MLLCETIECEVNVKDREDRLWERRSEWVERNGSLLALRLCVFFDSSTSTSVLATAFVGRRRWLSVAAAGTASRWYDHAHECVPSVAVVRQVRGHVCSVRRVHECVHRFGHNLCQRMQRARG